ncbi:hypothetical protein J2X09_004507 [Hydrogenophaga laconesensis]|uniref:Uncharacterized protein n=2 Tax=Hydrogenophaga laconesensis TaxID=1805971 RepID=A0ABU1VHF7_9BURK|nr:hypothetical protein [Hydrogenophaga laconesensis]
MNEYGHSTVGTWSAFTDRRLVVVVNPEDVAPFQSNLGEKYSVIPFSADSLKHMANIRAREDELDLHRGDYRWQAARFSWKVFAMEEAYKVFPDEDPVTWLDADSMLKEGFDQWLSTLFSPTHAVSFLGRAHKQLHAETGLINFRGALGRVMFERVLDIYKSLELFEFNEWTDSYIYTSVLQFNKHCFDICKHRGVRSSNPLYELDRGRHILHLKGMRKNSSTMLLDDLRVLLRR